MASACSGGSFRAANALTPTAVPTDTSSPSANPSSPPTNPATPPTTAPTATPSAPPAPATASAQPTPNPPPDSPLPTPPEDAKVFNHIEDLDGWYSCTHCAGGDNDADSFWTGGFRDSPSLDGSSREFFVGGPPWTAALFYRYLHDWPGQYNWAHHFLWDFWVYVDEDSMARVWDLEFDFFQAVDGYEYMIGTHCVFGSTWEGRNWEVYSQADHEWKQTDIPCSRELMPPGSWHHVQWYLRRVPDSTEYRYETLVVDGRAYDIGISQWAGRTGWDEVMGVQWQIDTDSGGGSAHEWLDKARLTVW